jgi:hypothetical protein
LAYCAEDCYVATGHTEGFAHLFMGLHLMVQVTEKMANCKITGWLTGGLEFFEYAQAIVEAY